MNRFTALLLLLLGLAATTLRLPAQTIIQTPAQADSLRRVIAYSLQHDTVRVCAMNELAYYYLEVSTNPDSALSLALEAQRISVKLGFLSGEATALRYIGTVYRNSGEYTKAFEYHTKSLRLSETLGDKIGIALSLGNIAIVYKYQGKYAEALEYYFKSLRLLETLGDKRGIALSLNNIAVVYTDQGKYAEALEYHFKSLRLSETLGDKIGIALSLNNIANVYNAQGKYTEALEYYFKSLRLREALGDKRGIASSLNNIAFVYNAQGKYTEALEYYFKSLRLFETLGDKRGIAISFNNIANVYKNQSKYAEALEYHFKSLRLREALGDKSRIAWSLNNIATVYKNQGKYVEALRLYQQSLQIEESLNARSGVSNLLINVASVYYRLSKFDSARVLAMRGFHLADTLGVPVDKRDATLLLAHILDSLGEHRTALAYYQQYTALKDSLVNLENLNKATTLREGYEAEKREQQIAMLNKERALQESELERQNANLARSRAEQKAQEQSLLALGNEKRLRELTLTQQEAQLTAAHLREDRDKQSLALADKDVALKDAALREKNSELSRQRLVQWSPAALVLGVASLALWLARLYRQKRDANREIMRQKAILEEQSTDIELANSQLNEMNQTLEANNEKLVELNMEKNEMLGIVSHDLKNPIGAVRGLAELVQSGYAETEKVPEISAQIVSTADRMLELVKNLLDVNQLESGGMRFQSVVFDIAPIVENTVWQYQTQAEAKNITLHYSSEAASNPIRADEQAMMQVLDNLISNAVKYSPHGKQVFVRVVSCEQVVRIEIQDEGPGISKDDMPKLFGKFARLSAHPTGGEHSTGLGLSIVKKMVEAMNGKVWCESELGRGAKFIVELQRYQST